MNRIWMSTCQLFDIYAMDFYILHFCFFFLFLFFHIFISYYLDRIVLRTKRNAYMYVKNSFKFHILIFIWIWKGNFITNAIRTTGKQNKNEQRFLFVQPKKAHKCQMNNEWRWVFEFMMLFLFWIFLIFGLESVGVEQLIYFGWSWQVKGFN